MGGGTRRRCCVPHAYCTTCEATVTVRDGQCLSGHAITTPILESARGRHRAPSRLEKLRPGRIMTAGHHRAEKKPDQPKPDPTPRPTPKAAAPRPSTPKPRPAPVRETRPVPQPQPRPASPARTSTWLPVESVPRSVYSSSMLEMLGMDEDLGLEPTFTTMTSPQPIWQAPAPVETVRRVGLDQLPTLADMRMVNDSQNDTGTLIERLWFATEEHEAVRPAADLRANDFTEAPSRTWRWSVIIAAVLVSAIAVALMQIGVRLPARVADEALATYESAIVEAQDVLPMAQDVMLAVTDPTVAVESLSDAAVTLARLDTASRQLFTEASEPLSSTPPLVSRAALDALTPLRTDMANASQDGLAIERRLGDALTYRLVFEKAFEIPDLPVTASSDEISTLGIELGLGLAATLDALTVLPNDPAFDLHRSQAAALADRFAEWQIDYLSALRIADSARAAILVEELQAAVDEARTGIANPLRAVESWATTEIERFETTLSLLAGQLP